jgi:hypothetical protein
MLVMFRRATANASHLDRPLAHGASFVSTVTRVERRSCQSTLFLDLYVLARLHVRKTAMAMLLYFTRIWKQTNAIIEDYQQ